MKTLNSGPDHREVHLVFIWGYKETEHLQDSACVLQLQQEKLFMPTQATS